MYYRNKDDISSSEVVLEDSLMLLDRDYLNNIVKEFINSSSQHLIINCENIRVIDTSGLGYLLIVLQRVEDAGKKMILKNPSDNVRQVLAMLKFESIFDIMTDSEEAILEETAS